MVCGGGTGGYCPVLSGRVLQSQAMNDEALELCDAWGLNPSEVRSITIHFYPGEIPFAKVTMVVNKSAFQVTAQLRPQEWK